MDDSTALLAGNSKKYNIPLSHFEHKYIQQCTDAKELERIYTELTKGDVGFYPDLEKLTLERIELLKPNSKILRQDKPPLDRSCLPDEERLELDNFLKQVKENNDTNQESSRNESNSFPVRTKTSTVIKSQVPERKPSAKRVLPRSYDEWGKLEKKINEEGSNSDEEQTKSKKTVETKKLVEPTKSPIEFAEEHRVHGNNAFRTNNYEEAIDAYTKSIQYVDNNNVLYMNRALAYYRINNYESSLNDCSHILSREPNHVKALFRRASCYMAQQRYEQAKLDLDHLLRIEPDNDEAKKLSNTIPEVQKPKGIRIPITEDDSEEDENNSNPTDIQPVKIPIMEVDDEEEEENDKYRQQSQDERQESDEIEPMQQDDFNPKSTTSLNIDIPVQMKSSYARPCIDSAEASPAAYDTFMNDGDDRTTFHRDVHQQLSGLSNQIDCDQDDDDDIPLGDEAVSYPTGASDDETTTNRRFNVSPHGVDDDADDSPPELLETSNMDIRSSLTSTRSMNTFNEPPIYSVDNTYNQYARYNRSYSENSMEEGQRSSSNGTASKLNRSNDYQHDEINDSNFGPTIQSLLHDKVDLQSTRGSSKSREKVWSKSSEPRLLNKIQRDIERFFRIGDYNTTIEASKKMLKNGILDYHNHADCISNTLVRCAQASVKLGRLIQAIQYATEALEYNKTDSIALMCRAKAYEDQEYYLYSYIDYSRIPSMDLSYQNAQSCSEKLLTELTSRYGDSWKEKLDNETDKERFLNVLKEKNDESENLYEWYRQRANQLYLDACFTLAIHCYTICIEMDPKNLMAYSNRAACYLKMFEPEKTIADCDRCLKENPKNYRALYRKACAFKMLDDDVSYLSALKELIKLQPNNQIILLEYYNNRRETIPRRMRRLREGKTTATTATTTNQVKKIESSQKKPLALTYKELEEIRSKITIMFSPKLKHQFTRQFDTLKTFDIQGQCSTLLRISSNNLSEFASSATPKLIEMIIRVCRTMVDAERVFQEEEKNSIVPFSYIQYSYKLVVEMTKLSRIESTLSMIDEEHRDSLDQLIDYFRSISKAFADIEKLDRLKKNV